MTPVIFALTLAASTSVSSQASPSALVSSQVASLIKRTQTTAAAYALVSTNEIPRDDGTIYEFGAEFNQGDLHRVETPRDRIVSNCRTGWSAHLNVATGAVTHEDGLSAVACGIYTGDGLRSAEITGSRSSSFGLLQQLKIETYSGTRTYEVAPNGAIVTETLADQNGKLRVSMKAISLSDQLPAGDFFSEASLATSAVPGDVRKKASDPSNWQAP